MELFDYWREYPPVHWLLRSYVGYRAPAKEMPDAIELSKALGIGRAKKKAKAPRDVLRMIESVKAVKVG